MAETSLSTPPKRTVRFEHSDRFSERKRALFPSQKCDSDSDLGHMSPLDSSSSPERYENILHRSKHSVNFRENNCKIIGSSSDLEQIENDSENSNDANLTVCYFSPSFTKIVNHEILQNSILNTPSPIKSSNKENTTIVDETPLKSPTEILKTPHDSVSTNIKIPKLIRKSLLDISNTDKSLKRKSESPEIDKTTSKHLKLDSTNKISKARTALFTETIFPAKSFYPKSNNKTETKFCPEFSLNKKNAPISKKPKKIYICNRGGKSKKNKSFGQINAGVRHGIKKPKRKTFLTKTQLLKAAFNIVKNSPLNQYLDNSDVKSTCSENGVTLEQIQKMDSILKHVNTRMIKPRPLTTSNDSKTSNRMKRPLSPQAENSNKKFFKSRPSLATITINDNIKLKVEHGEYSLIETENKFRRTQNDFTDFDISFKEEELIDESFTDILKSLNGYEKSSEFCDIKQDSLKNSNRLLSPTSLVCDLTSGLALDSPKTQIMASTVPLDKLSTLKKCISFPDSYPTTMSSNTINDQKLFPIFYQKFRNNLESQQSPIGKQTKESKHIKNIRKIWKPLSEDQTLIDAGQKRFGVTQCPDCKCVYSLGEPEDEIMHFQHHNSVGVLKYNAWKNERVVNIFPNGKVLLVNSNDPKPWLKKVRDIMEIVNRELGFVDVPYDSFNKKVFLCIINKQIVGCLVAEPKSCAHKMLSIKGDIEQCSEESYPVKCGVSRIWVAVTHRKQGIATLLINSMRSNFIYGHILSTQEIAFSAPTEAGRQFANKYMKTENFFVYS